MLYGLLAVIQIALSWASGPPLQNYLLAVNETTTTAHHRIPKPQSAASSSSSVSSSNGASGKLKVFIMMGQSNMVGFGKVGAPGQKGTLHDLVSQGKYPFLLAATDTEDVGGDVNNWSVRDDVRIIWRRGGANSIEEEEEAFDLTVGWSDSGYIGPEIGFGNVIGDAIDDPVLLIKVGTGNRALGWDFRPPGTKRYKFEDDEGEVRSFAGYGECPESSLPDFVEGTGADCGGVCSKDKAKNCPVFWPNITRCNSCFGWYAGLQFDRDLSNAKAILENLSDYYPDYDEEKGFEIAGFVFWQGERDTKTKGHAKKYRKNMRKYIKQLWKAYKTYPGKKKFVYATVAFGGCNSASTNETGYAPLENVVYIAQKETIMCRKNPNCSFKRNFKRKVKMIDARPYWRDTSISPANERSHYNKNAETYMEVGNALGSAMVDLLFKKNTYVKESCTKN